MHTHTHTHTHACTHTHTHTHTHACTHTHTPHLHVFFGEASLLVSQLVQVHAVLGRRTTSSACAHTCSTDEYTPPSLQAHTLSHRHPYTSQHTLTPTSAHAYNLACVLKRYAQAAVLLKLLHILHVWFCSLHVIKYTLK